LLQLVADVALEGIIAKQIDDLYATDPIPSYRLALVTPQWPVFGIQGG
jgi:hypothetical protein